MGLASELAYHFSPGQRASHGRRASELASCDGDEVCGQRASLPERRAPAAMVNCEGLLRSTVPEYRCEAQLRSPSFFSLTTKRVSAPKPTDADRD